MIFGGLLAPYDAYSHNVVERLDSKVVEEAIQRNLLTTGGNYFLGLDKYFHRTKCFIPKDLKGGHREVYCSDNDRYFLLKEKPHGKNPCLISFFNGKRLLWKKTFGEPCLEALLQETDGRTLLLTAPGEDWKEAHLLVVSPDGAEILREKLGTGELLVSQDLNAVALQERGPAATRLQLFKWDRALKAYQSTVISLGNGDKVLSLLTQGYSFFIENRTKKTWRVATAKGEVFWQESRTATQEFRQPMMEDTYLVFLDRKTRNMVVRNTMGELLHDMPFPDLGCGQGSGLRNQLFVSPDGGLEAWGSLNNGTQPVYCLGIFNCYSQPLGMVSVPLAKGEKAEVAFLGNEKILLSLPASGISRVYKLVPKDNRP